MKFVTKEFKPYAQSTWERNRDSNFSTYMGLYEAVKEQESEFEKELTLLQNRIKDLIVELEIEKSKVDNLQSSLTLYVTDESLQKEIIKMYSKGNSALLIHKNLTEFKKISVEYDTVTDVIFKLENDDLPLHLTEYYNECLKTLLTNGISEEDKIKIEELRRLKGHQEQMDSALNEINKRLVTCSVEEMGMLNNLSLKIISTQRENSKVMALWNKNSGQQGAGESGNNTASIVKEQLESVSKAILKDFDPSEIKMTKVN